MAVIDFDLLQEMINCAKREVAFRYKFTHAGWLAVKCPLLPPKKKKL